MVKNLPAMQETQVRSLGREDPLEKEMATHSRMDVHKYNVCTHTHEVNLSEGNTNIHPSRPAVTNKFYLIYQCQ